jgi:hypothetical protein
LVYIGTNGTFEAEVLPGWELKQSAKTPSNYFFEGDVKLIDKDHAGVILLARVMALGKDKNGKDNIEKTFDLLVSTGNETVESINVKRAARADMDPQREVIDRINGKRCFVTVDTEVTNKGNEKSVIGGFVAEAKYREDVARNAHRWVPKRSSANAQNGASAQPFNAGGGAGADTSATAF